MYPVVQDPAQKGAVPSQWQPGGGAPSKAANCPSTFSVSGDARTTVANRALTRMKTFIMFLSEEPGELDILQGLNYLLLTVYEETIVFLTKLK